MKCKNCGSEDLNNSGFNVYECMDCQELYDKKELIIK